MISYQDVLLHESDLELLQGPFWLNDQIIAFYYEVLTHESPHREEICFLPGAATFLVLNEELEVLKATLEEPLRLREKRHVFAAVNNNPDVSQAEGGSHWSLLLWDQSEQAFVHLDSCGGMNDDVAKATAKKLQRLMAVEGSVKFWTPSVPQQCNGYDCALYLLKFTEILSADLSKWRPNQLHILQSVKTDNISQFRKEILDLIESKR